MSIIKYSIDSLSDYKKDIMIRQFILFFLVCASVVFPGIYGLILAFKASLLLGIIVFIVEPVSVIIGWFAIIGRPDVCERIAEWFKNN